MTTFAYSADPAERPALGLIVLQSDETIEGDFRRMLPQGVPFFVSRVPSAPEVTSETLQQMAGHLTASAGLFPRAVRFGAIGYGCTSGTAQIGAGRISELIKAGISADQVTQPVTALIAACQALGLRRLAFLSPYVAEVSGRLREVLGEAGVETPVFGSFDEAEEAKVTRISAASVHQAAVELARQGGVDGVFLSCTNLRTMTVIDGLENALGLPVLSSNLVLGWHMGQLAGVAMQGPGRLMRMGA